MPPQIRCAETDNIDEIVQGQSLVRRRADNATGSGITAIFFLKSGAPPAIEEEAEVSATSPR